jgi:glycosyltransferase involved in cell wall biosynthesis
MARYSSNSMNLLLVTPFFAPQTGGVATYVEDLSKYLSGKGHNTYVLRSGDSHTITPCQTNGDEWIYEVALRVVWYPGRSIRGFIAFLVFFVPTLWRLTVFLRKNKIEVVSLEYPLAWMAYFFLVRLWMPIKVTVGLHGDDVLSLHTSPRHEQWLVKHMIRSADWVLAHSLSLLSEAERLVESLSDNRSYIPLGVDCLRLRDQAATDRYRLPVQSARYILTVAKLYPRKGIDVLLEAIGKLDPKAQDMLFAIAGDGPDEQALKQKARHMGIEHRVLFLGEIRRRDVPGLLKDCEFFVLPSRSEPFGLVLLEAMTFGKAIIATDVGGIPEFVIDGFNGLLVPSGDSDALAKKIEFCIENSDVRTRIGRNGLSVVGARYDYDTLVLRYERFYESLRTNKECCIRCDD